MASSSQKLTAVQTARSSKRKLFNRDGDPSRLGENNAVHGKRQKITAGRGSKRSKAEPEKIRADTMKKAPAIVSCQKSQSQEKKGKCGEQKDSAEKSVKRTKMPRRTPANSRLHTGSKTVRSGHSGTTKRHVGQDKQPRARIPKNMKCRANKTGGIKSPQYVTRCDEKFSLGEFVYILCETAEPADGQRHQVGEELRDECVVCQEEGEETMLECDSCLEGFHLTCLSPPLDAVPEGDWVCDLCQKAGGSRRQEQQEGSLSLRAKLFRGEVEVCKLLR